MSERDIDADITFHEFARRRSAAAHDKYANQEVSYRQARPDGDQRERDVNGFDAADSSASEATMAQFYSLPEVGDEVLVSLMEEEGISYDAVVRPELDDVDLGPVGLEIDELDDLNL